MSRPTIRKALPRPVHACPECHGEGFTIDQDWDDDGLLYRYSVCCEMCGGSCSLTSCACCGETMALGDAELLAYTCGRCVAAREAS